VDPTNWSKIGPIDWGRRVIRMIRPVYGPPFNNSKALWDSSDPETGYDLYLNWHDGTPSGFAIKDISPAGEMMEAYIEVPGTATSVEHDMLISDPAPADFQLSQNFPNPFNPTTTISFQLNNDSRVTLKVFNTLGQEITTLLNRQLTTGNHEVHWDGTDGNGHHVASGIYFYQIQAGDRKAVKKMMLMR